MTIEIRAFEETDLDRVMEIWRAATVVGHPFQSPEELDRDEALIRNEYMPQVDSWVAVDEGSCEIVGFISLAGGRIVALFVDPSLQRGGVGGHLVAHLNALHGPLSVEVMSDNAVAVPFYEKHGFRKGRVEPNPLYPDHDLWIMAQEGYEE